MNNMTNSTNSVYDILTLIDIKYICKYDNISDKEKIKKIIKEVNHQLKNYDKRVNKEWEFDLIKIISDIDG